MLEILLDKRILPFLAVIIVLLILMITRPSIVVNSATDKKAPYCLNPWITTLILLIVGFGVHALVLGGKAPSLKMK